MIDIVLAKKRLETEDFSLVIVNTHTIVYSSKRKGIFPLYDAVTNDNVKTQGASVADKVTGKGAALLCVYGKIKCLYSDIISKSALKVLTDNGVEVSYGKLVEYIKNREGDGRCPVETLASSINSPQKAMDAVEIFLKEKGLI